MGFYEVHVVDTDRDGLIVKEFDDYAASGSTIGDKIDRTRPKRGERVHRARLDDDIAYWRSYYYLHVERASDVPACVPSTPPWPGGAS